MSFPKYAMYKASGVEWLGDVPEHWVRTRLGFLSDKIGSGKTPLGGSETYADQGVVFIRSQNVYDDGLRLDDVVYITPDVDQQLKESRVCDGDVLLNITGASLGRTCLVPSGFVGGNVNQHVCIVRVRNAKQREFVAMSMKSVGVKAQIAAAQNGAAREGLNFAQLSKLVLMMPPPSEQPLIAEFLGREVTKIDQLVSEQRRLIELLKEKRQSVISHVVTKGVNPQAPMKPSGIEWLGNVPAHWEVRPLMRLTPDDRQIMYGIVLPGPNVENGIPIVKGGDVAPERLNPETLNRTTREIESGYVRSRLQGGDIVYAIRGSIGEAAIVPDSLTGANLTQDAARIAPKPEVDVQWLLFTMQSHAVFAQLEQTVNGATIRGINIYQLKRARIPCPPPSEQNSIAAFLLSEVSKLDGLIGEAEQAIELLLERRTALISAAVTGKIDVRGLVKTVSA